MSRTRLCKVELVQLKQSEDDETLQLAQGALVTARCNVLDCLIV